MMRRGIDMFRLWSVHNQSDLHQWLEGLIESLASYFELDESARCDVERTISFRDALNKSLDSLNIKAIPMQWSSAKNTSGLPLIARDKRKNLPALLLPHGLDFFEDSSNEVISRESARARYDEVHALFLTREPRRIFVPKVVVIIYSLITTILAATLAVTPLFLLSDTSVSNRWPLVIITVLSTILLMLAVELWRFLSQKNAHLWWLSLIHAWFERAIKSKPESASFISRGVKQVARLVEAKFFYRLVFALMLISLFAFIVATGFVSVFAASCYTSLTLIVAALANILHRHRSQLCVARDRRQADFMALLEHFGASLAVINGLRVTQPWLDRMAKEQSELSAVVSRIALINSVIDFSFLVVPVVYMLACVFMMDGSVALWQQSIALTSSFLAGAIVAYGVKRYGYYFKDKARLISGATMEKTHVAPVHIEGAIDLVDVTFAHDGSSVLIFDKLDLHLDKQRFYAICGPPGVGKTTLLSLCMGMSTPQSGHVVIDGQDMRSLDHRLLARHFGVVWSDSSLFAGTIVDNILCGRISHAKSLKRLLESHEIFDCLLDLPMGLNTYVFWHQNNLSRLERSVILLARALVHQPKILFLDDFLSGCRDTQKIVLDYLQNLPITRIITSREKIARSGIITIFLESIGKSR